MAPATRGAAELRVTVTDEQGKGLAGASVRALRDGERGLLPTASGVTDASGRLSLPKLPEGSYWLLAEATSRAREATMLAIAGDPREVSLVLYAEHTVDVRVKDEGGRPIKGAEVEVQAGSPVPVGALTDEEGGARVGKLGRGPFVVVARANGYEERSRTFPSEGKPCEIVLRRLGRARIRTVDEGGKPVGEARVEIAGAGLGEARSAVTTSSGDVEIGSLPAGSYALRAFKGNLVAPTELDVRVVAGEERTVLLRLAPGRHVDVLVVAEDERGAPPVRGANVVLAEDGLSPFPLEQLTGPGGIARLGPIAAEVATVSASAAGFVSRSGVPAPSSAKGPVRVVLPRAGTIEGRVVDARGFPVGGASLTVVGSDLTGLPIDDDPRRADFRNALFSASLPGPRALVPRGELGVVPGPVPPIPRAIIASVAPLAAAGARATDPGATEPWTTREDGTFRLRPVSPGRVRVVAKHPQYVEAASLVLLLEPGARVTADLVLGEGGLLEGTVVFASGQPAPRARVTALAREGSLERIVRTGDDGRFAFAALPRALTLMAEVDGGLSTRMNVDVESGAKKNVRIVLPEPRDGVELRVKDDRGYPVDGVELTLASLDPATPLRTTVFTDARGEARAGATRGLPLRVTATHPRFAPHAFSVEAATATLAITMARGEAVVGEVRGRREGPLAGAEVVAFSDMTRVRAATNTRGEFRVDGVKPGRVRLLVRARGHAKLEQSFDVDARKNDTGFDVGRLVLEPESVVEGEVVDENGRPVAGARVARDHAPTWVPTGALAPASGIAVSDARGAFRLGELPEGSVDLEAFAAELGRGRASAIRVSPGRPTGGVRIVLAKEQATQAPEANASGNVAVTLGTTDDGAVSLVSVADGSAAERAGLLAGDQLRDIDGVKVKNMEDARARLAGPVQDDVVMVVTRGDRTLTLRVSREASRR